MELLYREDVVEEIAKSVRIKAVEKWGEDRARVLAHIIAQTAQDIWRVEGQPPFLDEEPEAYR